MICNNCGIEDEFIELGVDDFGNIVLECRECGSIYYEDETLYEDDEDE